MSSVKIWGNISLHYFSFIRGDLLCTYYTDNHLLLLFWSILGVRSLTQWRYGHSSQIAL